MDPDVGGAAEGAVARPEPTEREERVARRAPLVRVAFQEVEESGRRAEPVLGLRDRPDRREAQGREERARIALAVQAHDQGEARVAALELLTPRGETARDRVLGEREEAAVKRVGEVFG
ncbi:MAG TPA: hypothetical protein ENJ09_00310, partial [Planctomycetes bacterium]|nr:hypothetical protein [Planctomycetota bacterium]